MSGPNLHSLFKLTGLKIAVIAALLLTYVALYVSTKFLVLVNPSPPSNNTPVSHRASTHQHPWWLGAHRNSTTLTPGRERLRHLVRDLSFLKDPIVNQHNFSYVIKPNISCHRHEIELVIAVVVSHNNFRGREVIRNTWGSYAFDPSNKAILIFFVGSVNTSTPISPTKVKKRSQILDESSKHGDILQESYIDSYENLTFKSVSILKWVSNFCSNAKYILKVDDDMYVNIPFMMKSLHDFKTHQSPPDDFIMGAMQIGAHPIRDPTSKWYAPYSSFLPDVYPKYVSGTAYVLTSLAAGLLFEASLREPSFWLEDIYITGLCSRRALVQVYDSQFFTYSKPTASGCTFRTRVSGHRYSHEEIYKIHKELYDPNQWCF